MHPRHQQALSDRKAVQQAPVLTVTAVEFRARAHHAGWSKDKITLQLKMARILGSTVLVGDTLLRIPEWSED